MRGYAKRAFGLSVAVGLIGLLGAPPADAAVTIGSNLVPPADLTLMCGGGCTESHAALPLTDTAPAGILAPISGVVVRWRIKIGGSTSPVTLRITRPGDSFTRIGAGTGPTVTPAPNAISTFDARLPIEAGDAIGVDCCVNNTTLLSNTGTGGNAVWRPPLQDGQTATGMFQGGFQLLLNADIEPDCDGDGFGDESQDASVDCAPPETTLTKHPQDKTKKKKATFEFSSSDPGSSFECTLDGKVFACASPLTQRVGKGEHSFAVRAKDAAGNVDSTPATFDWKVKKKKKK
jgi:hypothetical protein